MVNINKKNSEYSHHIIELLNVTSNAIRKVGYNKLIQQILRVVENSENPLKKELEVNILKYVSEEFQIPVEDIINSDKRGNVVTAKKITFVLFKKQLNISEYQIAKYFNRSPVVVNRAVKEFKKYNRNYIFEKQILESYNVVLEKINAFKEQTNYEQEITK